MRVVVFGDPHLDSGYKTLGDPDPDWVNTRLLDAGRVVRDICSEPCDILVFLGDVGHHPVQHSTVLSVMHEALAASPAQDIAIVTGNHDHDGRARSCLDVIAAGLPQRTHVFKTPDLVELGGLQIGALPWVPPRRFLAEGDDVTVNLAAAAMLTDLTRGLASRLDPAKPSLLGVHWFLAGSELASGSEVLTRNDPLLPVAEVEASGPWSAIVGGHNHRSQQVGDRTWVAGAPTRVSFDEEHIVPGFLVIDYDGTDATVTHHPTNDRPIRTITLDPLELLDGGDPTLPDLTGAAVRLIGQRTASQEQTLVRDHADERVVDACRMAGAVKVTGPRWETNRERRTRSDLTVEADPIEALGIWLGRQDLADDIRDATRVEALAIMEA